MRSGVAPARRAHPSGSLARLCVRLLGALMVVVVAWSLFGKESSASNALLAMLLTGPLWAPLYGLLHQQRRTFAWATLCVIPYFVLAITEAIANPEQRLWAGACIVIAFALFVALILYLRVSRPNAQQGDRSIAARTPSGNE